jgi:hypothetical protein
VLLPRQPVTGGVSLTRSRHLAKWTKRACTVHASSQQQLAPAIQCPKNARGGTLVVSRQSPRHGDRGVVEREAQCVIRDGDTEVLGDLAAPQQGADGEADLVGAAQRLSRRTMRA